MTIESERFCTCQDHPRFARMVMLSRPLQICGEAKLLVESTKGMDGWMTIMCGCVDDGDPS